MVKDVFVMHLTRLATMATLCGLPAVGQAGATLESLQAIADKSLAKIDADFQEEKKRLDQKYQSILTRKHGQAAAGGDLQLADAIQEEAARFRKEKSVPAKPGADTPRAIAETQVGYQETLLDVARRRVASRLSLLGKYENRLDALLKESAGADQATQAGIREVLTSTQAMIEATKTESAALRDGRIVTLPAEKVVPKRPPRPVREYDFKDQRAVKNGWRIDGNLKAHATGLKDPIGEPGEMESLFKLSGDFELSWDLELGAGRIPTWITVCGQRLETTNRGGGFSGVITIRRDGEKLVYSQGKKTIEREIEKGELRKPTTVKIEWRKRPVDFRKFTASAERFLGR